MVSGCDKELQHISRLQFYARCCVLAENSHCAYEADIYSECVKTKQITVRVIQHFVVQQ